jgi:hypothetical protein
MFQAMAQQIQSQPGPQQEPVPQAPGALQGFLAQLLGNLGSAMSYNPQYSAQTERALDTTRGAAGEAQQRNLYRENQFNLERQSAMLGLAGKRLDQAIKGAQDAKDQQQLIQLTNMKAELEKHQHEIDFQHDMAGINAKEQAESDRAAKAQAGENERNAARIAAENQRFNKEQDRLSNKQVTGPNGGKTPADEFDAKRLATEERTIGNKYGSKVVTKGAGPMGIGGLVGINQQDIQENPNKAANLKILYSTAAATNGSAAQIAARKLAVLVKKDEGITDKMVLAKRLSELGLSGERLDQAMSAAGYAPPKKK